MVDSAAMALRAAASVSPPRRVGARGHLVWTPEHDAVLGQAADIDLAAVWGIPHQPVWRRRWQLGRPPFGATRGRTVAWGDGLVRMLGNMPDHVIAQRFGLAISTVALKRQALGIANRQRRIAWTAEMDAILGRLEDTAVAARYGVARNSVVHRRQRLGIPPFRARKIDWSKPDVRHVLATTPIRTLARQLGVDPATVRRSRRMAGLDQ
jgi:hypothetical protein